MQHTTLFLYPLLAPKPISPMTDPKELLLAHAYCHLFMLNRFSGGVSIDCRVLNPSSK